MTQSNDEIREDDMSKKSQQSTALLLCEIPSRKAPNSLEQKSENEILDQQHTPWIAVHGTKCAMLVNDRTQVEIVDVCDAEERRKEKRTMLEPTQKVLAMAFSACGEFVAVAEVAGLLSLYKINGTLLFGHRVMRTDSLDSVVCIKFAASEEKPSPRDSQDLLLVTAMGMLLRLRDLRLAELEQKVLENAKEAMHGIVNKVRVERATIGRLKANASSCMLVHCCESEQHIVLGNHAAFLSVWQTTLGNQQDRMGIVKVSMCEPRSAPIDAMVFDGNRDVLVLLSQGKISWWNWREMTKLFDANVAGIRHFALVKACFDEEKEQDASLIAIVRASETEESMPLLQLVRVEHPEPRVSGNACAVSTVVSSEYVGTQSVCINMALFASASDAPSPQVYAACQTHDGVSMIAMANNGDVTTSKADETLASKSEEVGIDENAVIIAESLVNTPLSSLLSKRAIKKYRTMLYACTNSIGQSDDESRAVFKLLHQVATRIREFANSSATSSSLLTSLFEWCDEMSELSYQWTTFQLLQSSTASEAEDGRESLGKKWHVFRLTPMLEMLAKYIKLGSMRAVRILWSRHLNDDAVRNIGKLLHFLPASLPVSSFANWIQSEVIPALIAHAEQSQPSSDKDAPSSDDDNRSVLTELEDWLLERSEAAAANSDLDTALCLCQVVKSEDEDDCSVYKFKLQAAANCSRSLKSGTFDTKLSRELGTFERIERLSHKLRHIKSLAVEHHFVLSLSVFEDETPATIAMSMLDRVSDPESLRREVGEHVKRYLDYCDVKVDPVLHDYVTELAESMQLNKSIEEARALVLLDEISDVNVRADAMLFLLRSALPPYSQALKRYAHNCIDSWKTDHLEPIQEHVRLMEIQDMLLTYGIKHFDLADAKSASRLVSHILNQVSRATALTDAMLLVDTYHHLQCDRAVVQFTENLLAHYDAKAPPHQMAKEVSVRTTKAMQALMEVKRRSESTLDATSYASLMEEIIAFGVMLLEMEAEDTQQVDKDATLDGGVNAQSFLPWMLKSLVAAYLSELEVLVDTTSSTTCIEDPKGLLSDALLADLHRICHIEADYGLLVSVSVVRDVNKCKRKLKQLMPCELLFANGQETTRTCSNALVDYVGKGKGKKRTAMTTSDQRSSLGAKRPRIHEDGWSQLPDRKCHGLQRDEEKTRRIFKLNQFASAVGIESKTWTLILAQSAAKNGFVVQAARLSRAFFRKRSSQPSALSASASEEKDDFDPAEALKKVAISLSLYTSRNAKDIYNGPLIRPQQLPPAQVARIQAPMYTLELLKHALCMCKKEDFDDILVLANNTMLANEILQFTQHNMLPLQRSGPSWTLYPQWYRGDACVLPSYEAMKIASKFAISEHKNCHRQVQARDTFASKRCVSFLVEQRADLLSLQALMAMQDLPQDAASVVNTQMERLLSSVLQSHEIDKYLALGLMLSMKHEDAFHAFRRQISRENVAKDYYRFQQLAFVGADAARAWQQIAFLHQCIELEGNAKWWHYLQLLGIECDHKAFQGKRRDLAYIRRLVPTLITRSNYDFATVLEFTRHYQIEDTFASLAYAEALLLNECATTNLEYQDKIAGVVDEIHEQHLINLVLKSIPKVSGQDYDRLLFSFRLLLESTLYRERKEVERRVRVLHALKAFAAYQTTRATKHYQKTQHAWNADVMVSNGTSPGDKVLSFHEVIAKPRVVLAQVVNEENVTALIGLAQALGLEPDELQMLLLKNMVTTKIPRDSAGRSSIDPSPARFSAFEDLLKCLSDRESRVTAPEWLAENFPVGEEKLKALEFALHAAVSVQKGCEELADTSFTGQEALRRLQGKIRRVKVEMLFQSAGPSTSSLADVINDRKQTEELLALVSDPAKLFLELYRRYALWFYTHKSEVLHTVANGIGKLLELSHTKLRLELVHEWLVQDAVVRRDSLCLDVKETPFELLNDEILHRTDEEFVKRILYLVNGHVKTDDSFREKVVGHLVEFAKESRPRAGVTFRAKVRALRVLWRLGQRSYAAAERHVTTTYEIGKPHVFYHELLDYTKNCTLMMAFEEHRVPYDMEFVMKSDKERLTRSLLRRFPLHQSWVLRCASQVMLDFDVKASDLWESVLTSMMQRGMVRSLSSLMGPLSRKSFVRSLECGRQVWEDVLMSSMTQLKHAYSQQPLDVFASPGRHDTSTCTQDTKEVIPTQCFGGIPIFNVRFALERMVNLLQTCPFLDQMDVAAFVIHLRDLTAMAEQECNGEDIVKYLDLHGFAVKCALMIPKPAARFEALLQIIRAGAYRSVLHELLDTSCFLNGEQSEKDMSNSSELADNLQLIHESFLQAAKRDDYSVILGTPFELGFVEYLAATANIDRLLSLLLDDKRMEAALNAVELYYEYHPFEMTKADDEDIRETSDDKRWKLIDTYLASSTSAHLERYRTS